MIHYIDDRRRDVDAPQHVIRMRDDLLAACRNAASQAQGVFTLSAPTGSGKTLAMLAFALEHAVRYQLRRIVLVVPYLSIIEQTARIYRELFEGRFGRHYLLEHHSLAQTSAQEGNEDDRAAVVARQLTENWDAPIVITTSVQFFESLFSNRSSACRKLHRLAGSVVLFDEVQTFPVELAVPTLATLAHLAERHRCTTVFATATQPAFTHFDAQVKEIGGPGWHPREIVSKELNLFQRAKRTVVHWPKPGEQTAWDELARELASHQQVLCIVNLKKHAKNLVERLREAGYGQGLFHLSTNLCPAHRTKVLDDVRNRLDEASGGPCRLVATQCVEAGVDIDFPVVYRALGPLEAIAQAAGRCNRNGRLASGDVKVFLPEKAEDGASSKSLYPPGGYAQAAGRTEGLLSLGPIDLDDPDTFSDYYRGLYPLNDYSKTEIIEAIKAFNFKEAAEAYRLINQRTINLVVPYDRALFDSLREEAMSQGLTREWIRCARPLAVSVYGGADRLAGSAAPAPLTAGAVRADGADVSDEWFLLLDESGECYDCDLLGLKELQSTWIA